MLERKKWIIGIFLLIVPLISFGQTIEDREVADYNKIRIFGKLSVLMVPGTDTRVHVESENISLEEIETEVEDKELKIKMTSKLLKQERPDVFIRVTFKDLEAITALGDAEIDFEKPLVRKFFAIKATSGSYITLVIDAEQLELRAYQGGQVQIKGETDILEGYVNTGGILSGTDLVCQKVDVKLNTGGKGELTVKKELEANVNTGSDFSYFGTPEKKDLSTSFGGTISAWDEEE